MVDDHVAERADEAVDAVRHPADELLGAHAAENVAFGGRQGAQADALQAQGVGARQAGGGGERRQVDAAGASLFGNLDLSALARSG
jgi:hypothetical protein